MTKRQKVRNRMFHKIRQFEQSGLSKSDFCAMHRIGQSQMHYWLKVYASANAVEESAPSFIPVVIDDTMSGNDNDRIVVTAHGGLQVSFPAQAASIPLIRQLLEG